MCLFDVFDFGATPTAPQDDFGPLQTVLSGAKLISLRMAIPMDVCDSVAQEKRPRQVPLAGSLGKNRLWIERDITTGIVWASPDRY
jgi:hypothetical protein